MESTAGDRPRISVVIPVYNNASGLPLLVDRLVPALAACSGGYEVLLVNDGSRDESWESIGRLCVRFPHLRGINLMRNYGQHNALLAGIRAARHGILVTMDDDLQHPPEEIPRLLAGLAAGADVVYGAPERERHGFWRTLASQVTKRVLQDAMGAETARQVSAFRAFRAPVAQAFADFRSPYVCLDVMLTWGTRRFAVVPVRHDPRATGESTYTWRTLVRHALNMMTGFSVWPLRLASLVGFGFTLFGLSVLAFVLGRYLGSGTSVQGFPFLASIVAIFSGAQLFALGIIGEYLARMHVRAMERPAYVIRSRAGAEDDTVAPTPPAT